MASRQRALNGACPFAVSERGSEVDFIGETPALGQAAYLISLPLSNLQAITPLVGPEVHPSEEDVRALRQYFQYFATAALAAEVGGSAWSFGFPRPDGTGFLEKLSEVWSALKDGSVQRDTAAPASPKDDGVDVFAWREQHDGLPGFLLAAAQVATGGDWKDKPIKTHVKSVFPGRWFHPVPVTEMVAYHVVPFALPDERFRDDVRVLGNALHRTRLPRRVSEAAALHEKGLSIEAFDRLRSAPDWIQRYLHRARHPQ